MKKRDIELLYEIGTLRNTERSWRQMLGITVANDLEHMARLMFLSLILARAEGVRNEEKILKMVMVHDLSETRTGDGNYTHKVYVKTDDERAARDTLAGTSLSDLFGVLKEYEARESMEAKIVKDADNLDVDIELRELEERGSRLPAKWKKFRRLVRDKKLYTKSAKRLWDSLQKSNPASWHLAANKWLKVKNAGK